MQSNCSLAFAKLGTLRFAVVYSCETNSIATKFLSVETNICISCLDRDGSVHVGALYKKISARRQLLKFGRLTHQVQGCDVTRMNCDLL
jgi:hypothetical protein